MITIYLTDDDADDRDFFEEALKELNIETELTITNDGTALMTTLADSAVEPPPPHVIFLDLNMPGKNGFECLKEIRTSPKLKNIPVIIFSTSANAYEIDKSYSMGANCYIRKPNSHKLLKQTIEAALSLDLWTKNTQLAKDNFLLAIS